MTKIKMIKCLIFIKFHVTIAIAGHNARMIYSLNSLESTKFLLIVEIYQISDGRKHLWDQTVVNY